MLYDSILYNEQIYIYIYIYISFYLSIFLLAIKFSILLIPPFLIFPTKSDILANDRNVELYVECALYIDSAPFGLFMRLRFSM